MLNPTCALVSVKARNQSFARFPRVSPWASTSLSLSEDLRFRLNCGWLAVARNFLVGRIHFAINLRRGESLPRTPVHRSIIIIIMIKFICGASVISLCFYPGDCDDVRCAYEGPS